MDEFVEFNYLLLDAAAAADGAATVVERTVCCERVDLVPRQFRDFLNKAGAADEQPRGMVMTHDFKVRGQATRAMGWLSFHVDRGDGKVEQLERVALVAFARGADEEVRRVLQREAPPTAARQLPPAPFAVGVLLTANVPSIVRDFLTKAAAGFFSREFAPRSGP